MKYQLVLQFRGDSLEDYDAMMSLDDELIETLRDSAKGDGHDVGSGEVNIFIFTTEPQKTFQLAKHALERRGCLQPVTAAYRPVDGEDYTVIWPTGSVEEFRIAYNSNPTHYCCAWPSRTPYWRGELRPCGVTWSGISTPVPTSQRSCRCHVEDFCPSIKNCLPNQ